MLKKGTHIFIHTEWIDVKEVTPEQWEQFTSSVEDTEPDKVALSFVTDMPSQAEPADNWEYWEYDYDLLNRMVEVKKNNVIKAEYI